VARARVHGNRYRDGGLRRDRDRRRPARLPRRWDPGLAVAAERAYAGPGPGAARAARPQLWTGGPLPGGVVSDVPPAGAVRRDRDSHAERRLPERPDDPAARDVGLRLADLLSLDSGVAQRSAILAAAFLLSGLLPHPVCGAVRAVVRRATRRVAAYDLRRHGDVLSVLRRLSVFSGGRAALRVRRRAQRRHPCRAGALCRLAAGPR